MDTMYVTIDRNGQPSKVSYPTVLEEDPLSKASPNPAAEPLIPTLRKHTDQTGPFFALPLEVRKVIYEEIFLDSNAYIGQETLMPGETFGERYCARKDQNLARSTVHKNGLTAILSSCQQANEEATAVWQNLLQFYQNARRYETDTFELVRSEVWQNLRDITINITAAPMMTFHPGDMVLTVHTCSLNQTELARFIELMASSHSLKRLHIVPTIYGTQGDWNELSDMTKRVGIGVIKNMWTILKGFAKLPRHIDVTTQAVWEGYDNQVWKITTLPLGSIDTPTMHESSKKDLLQCTKRLLESRQDPLARRGQCRGFVDADGRPFIVGTIDDLNESILYDACCGKMIVL